MRTGTSKVARLAVICMVVLRLIAIDAMAASTVDQQQATVGASNSIGGTLALAQFLVTGVAGEWDQVDLYVSRETSICATSLEVEVRGFQDGVGTPNATVYASETVPWESIGGDGAWISVPIDPPIQVAPNQGYNIVVSAPSAPTQFCYLVGNSNGNPYQNGFLSSTVDGGASWGISPFEDLAFETFVELASYEVAVSLAGSGGGSVTSSPAGIDCGTVCAEDFVYGSDVVLTAVPDGSSAFTGWSGACSGTGTCELDALDEAKDVTATFADVVPPIVSFEGAPRLKTRKRSASFTFQADEAGVTYECSLDGAVFEPCESPVNLKKLRRGRHTFEVKATDAGANVGDPATYDWKVKKRRK